MHWKNNVHRRLASCCSSGAHEAWKFPSTLSEYPHRQSCFCLRFSAANETMGSCRLMSCYGMVSFMNDPSPIPAAISPPEAPPGFCAPICPTMDPSSPRQLCPTLEYTIECTELEPTKNKLTCSIVSEALHRFGDCVFPRI